MSNIELPVICGECGHRHTHFVTQEQLDALGTPSREAATIEKLTTALRQASFYIRELGPTSIDKDLTLRVINDALGYSVLAPNADEQCSPQKERP